MDAWPASQKLGVGSLAAQLHVKERTLYQAFHTTLGVGPYEFFQLQRLHRFREAILDGDPYHGRIKQAAQVVGLQDLARATQSYRRYFNETPRQTLRRRTLG